MTIDLRFYQDYVDEEHDKVMFDILVRKLFAFILVSAGTGGVRIVSSGRYLSSILYTAMKQDENIQRIDIEEPLTMMSTPVVETASRHRQRAEIAISANFQIWAKLEPHDEMENLLIYEL
jgi:hypothetical protein